jgi:hypothetical protein
LFTEFTIGGSLIECSLKESVVEADAEAEMAEAQTA